MILLSIDSLYSFLAQKGQAMQQGSCTKSMLSRVLERYRSRFQQALRYPCNKNFVGLLLCHSACFSQLQSLMYIVSDFKSREKHI